MSQDNDLVFDDNVQHLTTEASAKYINLGFAEKSLGAGVHVNVEVVVKTAMTDSGSNSTQTVTLEQDDNAAFSSPTEIKTIGVFAAGSAVGQRIEAALSPSDVSQQYLRLKYTVANGDLTAGKFTSQLRVGNESTPSYASGFTA